MARLIHNALNGSMTRRTFGIVLGTAIATAALGLNTPQLSLASEETQTVTDMAGREVEIPQNPTKIMGAANPDGIILYSVDPSLMTGWTAVPSDAAKAYLTPEAADLPQITSVSVWEEPNKEEILSMDPDFILVACDLDNTDFALYDDLSAEIGVPIVVIDADLPKLGDSYRFLASILPNQADHCIELADYIDRTFEDVDRVLEQIPEEDRIRVLYSTGADGTQTCGDSNWNGQFVTPAGGINVCDTDQTSGFANVSMEQVLTWQPDVIISTATGDKTEIYGAPEWADIAAVEAGEIYAAPQTPFSWVDKPTGVNRVIGVKWTNSVLYPDQVDYDIAQDVADFYDLFYHYQLTDEEIEHILDTKVEL